MARYAAVTYVGMAASLVSAPILAQTLGADGRGVLAGTFVVMQVLGWVAFLGLPSGLALQMERRREVSLWGVAWTGVIGIIAFLVAFVSAPILANNDPRIELGIRIVSVLLIFSGAGSLGAEVSLLGGSVGTYNAMRASTLVLPSAAIIAMFALGRLTLVNAFIAMLAGQIISVVIGCIVVARRQRTLKRGRIPWNFSVRVWVSSVFDSVGGRGDQLALTALSSAPVVGVYAIAVTCASAASGVAQALNFSSVNQFVRASRDGEGSAPVRLMFVSAALTAAASAGIFLVVLNFGTLIFGLEFESLPPIVAVLALAAVLQDMWRIRAAYENANERAGILAIASAAGLLVMLVIIVILATTGLVSGFSMAIAFCAMSASRLVTYFAIAAFRK